MLSFQTNEEIQQFVSEVYRVHFPVFAKVDVIGETVHEAWKFLTCTTALLFSLPKHEMSVLS